MLVLRKPTLASAIRTVVGDGTRRQMYGDGVALDSSRAIFVWSHDDGTYTGEATIYEAEVNKG